MSTKNTSLVKTYSQGFFLLVAALFLAACGTTPGVSTGNVSSVTIDTPTATTLATDGTLQLSATVAADAGVSTMVNWSSSSTAVATVDTSGLVTAVTAGTVTITATSQADSSKLDTIDLSVAACGEPETINSNISTAKALTKITPAGCIDYLVEGSRTVSAEITVSPGVIISFAEKAGLKIIDPGSLQAIGTAEQPILMTAQNKDKGFWNGLVINSNTVKNELSFVTVEYAVNLLV